MQLKPTVNCDKSMNQFGHSRHSYQTNRQPKGLDDFPAKGMQDSPGRVAHRIAGIYMLAIDFAAVRVEEIAVHFGGVTASTEVIAVKRHTGVRASVIVRKNTIANQNLAYAA
jgi:hypothetical protein